MDLRSFHNKHILLLGEGDFSFSVALLNKTAELNITELLCINITSTSLLSESNISHYASTSHNIELLLQQGVRVLFDVNATRLSNNTNIWNSLFDGIIFNFPHIGGKSNIKKNRLLLKEMFLSTVDHLTDDGSIYVSLCNGQGGTAADHPRRDWCNNWQIVAQAACAELVLSEAVPFLSHNFQEYSSTGFRSQDKHFSTKQAITHVFRRGRVISPLLLPTSATYEETIEINDVFYSLSQHVQRSIERVKNILANSSHLLVYIVGLLSHFVGSEGDAEFMNLLSTDLLHTTSQVNIDKYEVKRHPGDSDGEKLFVRSSLYESIYSKTSLSKQSDGMQLFIGDVYHPAKMNRNINIVRLELIGLHNQYEALERFLSKLLTNMFPCLSFEYRTDCTVDIRHNDINNVLFIHMSGCNVDDTRVGRISKVLDQKFRYSFLVHLDLVLCSQCGFSDTSFIWSENLSVKPFTNPSDAWIPISRDLIIVPSVYPPQWVHDMSFWVTDEETFNENHLLRLILDCTPDILKCVELLDVFHNEYTNQTSRCYRLVYESCDAVLSHRTAEHIQTQLREYLQEQLPVVLR